MQLVHRGRDLGQRPHMVERRALDVADQLQRASAEISERIIGDGRTALHAMAPPHPAITGECSPAAPAAAWIGTVSLSGSRFLARSASGAARDGAPQRPAYPRADLRRRPGAE